MRIRPFRRRTRVCTRTVLHWDRVYQDGEYQRTLHTVNVGDVMPKAHYLVKRYKRHVRRGDK
jgi:hypothetical protein